jgi:hypothetical protein
MSPVLSQCSPLMYFTCCMLDLGDYGWPTGSPSRSQMPGGCVRRCLAATLPHHAKTPSCSQMHGGCIQRPCLPPATCHPPPLPPPTFVCTTMLGRHSTPPHRNPLMLTNAWGVYTMTPPATYHPPPLPPPTFVCTTTLGRCSTPATLTCAHKCMGGVYNDPARCLPPPLALSNA